ncbi:MAG TPA: hypothetical protein VG942_01700, partial [Hyphomonadaceae bacterium]|nr:hypothetical protein [Hyphomonadaceae bacterium]
MAANRFAKWLVVGAALTAITACDQVQDRLNKFGKLTDQVIKQVSGQDTDDQPVSPVDALKAAPVEARALFGKVQAYVEPPPMTLQDMLSTQSFYAVGSIIAEPKEQVVEPVVDPESFDLAAADPSKPATADAASSGALNSAEVPAPKSAELPAGAPAPAPPPPAAEAPPAAADSAAKPAIRPNLRSLSVAKPLSPVELRQRAQVAAPKALQQAVRDSGVQVDKDALRAARLSAEQGLKATSKNAQQLGDELALKTQGPGPLAAKSGGGPAPAAPAPGAAAPGSGQRALVADRQLIPKALAIRTRLTVDTAV